MNNYELLSGPFIGEVVESGAVLDLAFEDLDDDMQARIRGWGEQHFNLMDDDDFPCSLEELKDLYESRWDSEETDKAVTMLSLYAQAVKDGEIVEGYRAT